MTASNLLVTLYPQNSKFNSCKNFCVEIHCAIVKFMFSKKATKIDEIFTVDLTLCSKCQIDGEDFVNICGLLRKHELYNKNTKNKEK